MRHAAVYVPSGSGGSPTLISVASLESTTLSPLSTRAPAPSSTRISLNRASSGSVNQMDTRRGDSSNTALADGIERT